MILYARPAPVRLHNLLNTPWREWPVPLGFEKVPIIRVRFHMALQHEPKCSGEQNVAIFSSLAAFDEDLVPVQIDIFDFDAARVHPHGPPYRKAA